MKYEKPKVVEFNPAIQAVQNSSNKETPNFDSDPSVATTNAYQADE
jgi:hypothetical protein